MYPSAKVSVCQGGMLNTRLPKNASSTLLQVTQGLPQPARGGLRAQHFISAVYFSCFVFAEGTLILPLVCLCLCIFPSRKSIADPATVIPLFCKAGVDTHVGAGVVTLAVCPS